jgi:hypothetical protein
MSAAGSNTHGYVTITQGAERCVVDEILTWQFPEPHE